MKRVSRTDRPDASRGDAGQIPAVEMKRLVSLRMSLLESHPFWGFLLLPLKLVPDPELPAFAATDCLHHIWFNPEYTRHLSVSQLGFVLLHEVCHLVFASHHRRGGRNLHLWNCATDYAINRIIAEIPHPVFRGKPLYERPEASIPGLGEVSLLFDERFDDMIAETIYETLLKEEEDAMADAVEITITLPRPGEDSSPWNLPGLRHRQGNIDIHLPYDLSDGQHEELVERVIDAIEQWQRGEGRGHFPAGELRDLLPGERGKVAWQRILQSYVGQALARDDYSLARPNRRYLECDLVVPGLYSERIGGLVIALDTSGSMTESELSAACVEIVQLSQFAEECLLIVADAQVHEVVPTARIDAWIENLKAKGGGGTDHRPVFDWLKERNIRPELFIGLTDLFSTFPKKAPTYPVLWVTGAKHGKAPWGRVITIS